MNNVVVSLNAVYKADDNEFDFCLSLTQNQENSVVVLSADLTRDQLVELENHIKDLLLTYPEVINDIL